MRRKYLGLAIAAITALGPASAFGGDREICNRNHDPPEDQPR